MRHESRPCRHAGRTAAPRARPRNGRAERQDRDAWRRVRPVILRDERVLALVLIVRIGVREAFCSIGKPLCTSGEPLIGARWPEKPGGEARCSIGGTAKCPGKALNFTRKAKRLARKPLFCFRQPEKRSGEAFSSIGVMATCPGKALSFARKAKRLARKAARLASQGFYPCARSSEPCAQGREACARGYFSSGPRIDALRARLFALRPRL